MHLYGAFGLQIDSDIPIFLLNKNKAVIKEKLAKVRIKNNEALELPLPNYSQRYIYSCNWHEYPFYRKESDYLT